MALRVALDPSGTGLDCSYWKIGAFHLDFQQQQVTLFMHGWTDTTLRQAGRSAAAALLVVLRAADLPQADMHRATTTTFYQALKSKAASMAAGHDGALERATAAIGPEAFAEAVDC